MRLLGAVLVAAGVLALACRARKRSDVSATGVVVEIDREARIITIDSWPEPTELDVFRAWANGEYEGWDEILRN